MRERKTALEKKEALRDAKYRKQYGITLLQYNQMYIDQGGRCKICGEEETKLRGGKVQYLCIDHCHETNKVRGLLCYSCNIALGHFKDNTKVLQRAIDYLSDK